MIVTQKFVKEIHAMAIRGHTESLSLEEALEVLSNIGMITYLVMDEHEQDQIDETGKVT